MIKSLKNQGLKISEIAVLRFETIPGEQTQVDWGYCGKIFDVEERK